MINKFKYYLIILALLLSNFVAYSQSTFSSDRLINSLELFIKSKYDDKITIDVISNIQDKKFTKSKVKAKFDNLKTENKKVNSIDILFMNGNDLIEKVNVKFKIKKIANVWMTQTSLPKNSVIAENDIYQSEEDIFDINEELLLSKDELIGSKVNRTISKNTIITKENLAENNLIKSGDRVNLIVQSGSVTIRTTGSALQDATAGQNVRVKRDGKTTQVIQGTVLNDGTVFIGLK